jgi:hypothetical protein
MIGLDRYPTHGSLRLDGDRAWIAFAASEDTNRMRYTRHVEVWQVTWVTGAQPSWSLAARFVPEDADDPSYGRFERPALGLADGVGHAAAVAYKDDGTYLVHMDQTSPGSGWTAARTLDAGGTVYAHVGPTWSDDGVLWWARLGSAATVEICSWEPDDAAPACQDTGASWIDSLAPTDGGVVASVSDGDLAWRVLDVPLR